ncbi:MAG: TonB-dependent receptor, partial [Flavobacteriaceae bacterium]|nr:TonB-dependent receptor [Flavobacteriaceae bacterium]
MRNITKILLAMAVFVTSVTVVAQGTVSGVILDSEINTPLPGASIIEKGTTNGTTSDFNGNFRLNTQNSTGELEITYVGYATQTIAFSGDQDLGSISMESTEFGLQEILVTASVAVDRKTPVAVSTIKSADIDLKLGT